MVPVRESPPKVRGAGFGVRIATAKTEDGIETDTMRVNTRAMTVFATFFSRQTQVVAIILQPGDDFNCIQPPRSPASAKKAHTFNMKKTATSPGGFPRLAKQVTVVQTSLQAPH
jgi:hypothetical protein